MARSDAIKGKIHRQYVVRPTRPEQRLALADQDLLAPAAPDMQLFEPGQPLNPLVVNTLAGLMYLQVDHAYPEAPMALRQGDDARP